MSTDAEEQSSSFEAQKDYYERLINETPGWTFAGIYADVCEIIGLCREAA